MDLLKDITNELRGGDESTNDGGHPERSDDAGDEKPTERSTTATGASGSDDETGVSGENAGASGNRDDGHLCSFCETEFDASRNVCPECDAEIVIRGAR